MIHKRLGKYEKRMETWFGTLNIPPNYDNMKNFAGSNALGKHNSIYNPMGSQNS
jgi:hypothetical protein